MACRDCCPLHVGTQARTGLGEGRRRGGNTLSGKTEGGREEIGGSEEEEETQGRLLRKFAQLQGLGREQGNSSWVRTTFAHLLSRARTA